MFVLEVSDGRIHSMNPDGSDRKLIVSDCRLPDGVALGQDLVPGIRQDQDVTGLQPGGETLGVEGPADRVGAHAVQTVRFRGDGRADQ